MNMIRSAVRDGNPETAIKNEHLQTNYITKKLNLLNVFYGLVALYWVAIIVEALL